MHWKGIKEDAIHLIQSCDRCQKWNITKQGFHPIRTIEAELPGDHWAIDTAGPFPTSHRFNHYILIIVDVCTRFCILSAIPDKSSTTIVSTLIQVFCDFGLPKVIQSDNGTEYVNELVELFAKMAGIDHRLISAYHPRANGLAERYVKSAVNTVRKAMDINVID